MTLAQARRRFKRFHERDPVGDEIGVVQSQPRTPAFKVGKLVGVIYETPDLTRYIHQIKKTSRPTLYVSADGSQMFMLGGSMKFTERGFVDKAKPKRRSR